MSKMLVAFDFLLLGFMYEWFVCIDTSLGIIINIMI